jgi:hypothetical protein
LVYQLLAQRRRCPNEKVVIAGYSQGAWAIHGALNHLAANEPGIISSGHIAAIVLVADANLIPFTGTPRAGTAPYASQGVFTATPGFTDEDIPAPLQKTTLNVCNAGDAVCDFRGIETALIKDLAIEVHTKSYYPADLQQWGSKAADIVMNGGSFWG